jgi:hypothetical protein
MAKGLCRYGTVRHFIDKRPGLFPGLFVCLVVLSGARAGEHAPFHLLAGDLFRSTGALDSLLRVRPDDTAARESYELRYAYNNFFHAREVDAKASRNVLSDRTADADCFSGSMTIKRAHWAVMPSWEYTSGDVRSVTAGDPFRYTGTLFLEKTRLAGWAGYKNVMVVAGIGFNFFDTSDNRYRNRIEILPSRLETFGPNVFRYDYLFAIGGSRKTYFASAYIKKTSLPAAHGRIQNAASGAAADFWLAAQRKTYGCYAAAQRPFFTATIDAGYSEIFSDTGLLTDAALPVTVSARALHGALRVRFPLVALRPELTLTAASAHPRLRAFDQPGGPYFFRADSNAAYAASGELSGSVPGGITTGLCAEYFSFGNIISGLLDPYLFSNMSVFDPKKYKIDSLRARYWSYGAFVARKQKLFPWWELDAALTAVRASARSCIRTRTYDFTYIIPVLTDPRKIVLIDEDYLLFVLAISTSVRYHGVTFGVNAQQAIPIGLKKGRGGAGPGPGAATKKSVGGGTRIEVRVGVPF